MIVLRFFWPVLWFFLGALVAYAWIAMRQKLRRSIQVPPPRIDQDDIRRIEEEGALLRDDPEPLDLKQIKREEDEFWRETWDEARRTLGAQRPMGSRCRRRAAVPLGFEAVVEPREGDRSPADGPVVLGIGSIDPQSFIHGQTPAQVMPPGEVPVTPQREPRRISALPA